MSDQPQGKAKVAGPETADEALTQIMDSTSRRLAEYAKEWIGSFNSALKGEYTAERLAKDATRMTSELIRDAAKLFVSGYEFVELVADLPKPTTPASTGPASTTPASTGPASTTPASTTPASTGPAPAEGTDR
jgi:hypothetical protein